MELYGIPLQPPSFLTLSIYNSNVFLIIQAMMSPANSKYI